MRTFFGATALAAAMRFTVAAQAQFLIIGNDEKVSFDDGKQVLSPPGKDTVTIVDISDRTKPRIVTSLQLENSIVGPPTNLAITPDNKLALVANSLDVVKDGDALKAVPDNKVYVIDLTASPPAMIATVQTGKQPSGMAINRAGNLALVANRAGNSVSVLSISGRTSASSVRWRWPAGRSVPAGVRRGDHTRRQTRAGDQGRGQQGVATRDQRHHGHLQRL